MDRQQKITGAFLKWSTRILCEVDAAQLSKIPMKGPLILAANHINFLDVPLIFSHLLPRPITGFAKIETWDNPLLGWMFSTYNAIPIRRGEADLDAMETAEDVLAQGQILAIAPEGTRSRTGCLQRGHPGIVMLAMRSGAPIQPLAHYGGERVWAGLKRLQRAEFHIKVGSPFTISCSQRYPSREERQLLTDEIMYQLASLLPADYRGFYSNLESASQDHLNFPGGIESSLNLFRKSLLKALTD